MYDFPSSVLRGSQLTILYDGQVVVFDDVQADKAKDIISFANTGMSQNQNGYVCSYPAAISASSSRPFPFLMNIIPTTANNSVQEHPQAPSKSVICGNFLLISGFFLRWMVFVFLILCFVLLFIQIYLWLEKLHFIGSWRKERIGKWAESQKSMLQEPSILFKMGFNLYI